MKAQHQNSAGNFKSIALPNNFNTKPLTTRKNQHGFTLVELMVTMTIGLFLLAAIGLLFMTSKAGFSFANNTVRMSEDASYAIESISRDVRMAAYGGCAGTILVRSAGADAVLYTADDVLDYPIEQLTKSTPNLFRVTGLTDKHDAPNPFATQQLSAANAIMGFKGTGTASDTARTAISAPTSTLTISTTSPILFVSGGSDRALQVNAVVAAGAETLNFTGDPMKWVKPNVAPYPYMLISDCKGAELFRMTTMTSAGAMTLESPLINAYGPDAIVTPLVSSAYFLATHKNGTVSAATTSLYRRYFNGSVATFEELVPNIEAIDFQYGVNTQSNLAGPHAGEPTFQTDIYRTADNVADWSRVVSVRISFILVSDEANITAENENTIYWSGGTGEYTPPNATDRRLRRAYSTTVSIRNRMGV